MLSAGFAASFRVIIMQVRPVQSQNVEALIVVKGILLHETPRSSTQRSRNHPGGVASASQRSHRSLKLAIKLSGRQFFLFYIQVQKESFSFFIVMTHAV